MAKIISITKSYVIDFGEAGKLLFSYTGLPLAKLPELERQSVQSLLNMIKNLPDKGE